MLRPMFTRALVVAIASISIACGQAATLAEPTPTELLHKASANLTTAKTAHIEGTGSFAVTSGLSANNTSSKPRPPVPRALLFPTVRVPADSVEPPL